MMKDLRQWIGGAVAVIGALSSQGVAAQHYLGIEASREDLSFKPEYHNLIDSSDDRYNNRADGSAGSVLVGYRWVTAKNLSVDLQGRLSVSNTEWAMVLPQESASFRYDLPVSAAVSLLPAYRLTDALTVFAEAGLALGKIRLSKSTTNADSSAYDVSKWRPGLVAGFGMSFTLNPHWSVRAGYRRTWYQDHDFATRRADGTRMETVTSSVVQSMKTIALIRDF